MSRLNRIGCIGRSGCYGPREIRQDIHACIYRLDACLVDVTETNSDANKFKLMLGLV